MIVIAAHYLGQQIEAACTDNKVDYLVEGGNLLRSLQQSLTLYANTDHARQGEAQLDRVGDGDDLHDMRVDEVSDALAHAGLRDAQIGGDSGEGAAPILLQRLDNALIDLIYCAFIVLLVHSLSIVPRYPCQCNARAAPQGFPPSAASNARGALARLCRRRVGNDGRSTATPIIPHPARNAVARYAHQEWESPRKEKDIS